MLKNKWVWGEKNLQNKIHCSRYKKKTSSWRKLLLLLINQSVQRRELRTTPLRCALHHRGCLLRICWVLLIHKIRHARIALAWCWIAGGSATKQRGIFRAVVVLLSQRVLMASALWRQCRNTSTECDRWARSRGGRNISHHFFLFFLDLFLLGSFFVVASDTVFVWVRNKKKSYNKLVLWWRTQSEKKKCTKDLNKKEKLTKKNHWILKKKKKNRRWTINI